jgi:hypothetical protein
VCVSQVAGPWAVEVFSELAALPLDEANRAFGTTMAQFEDKTVFSADVSPSLLRELGYPNYLHKAFETSDYRCSGNVVFIDTLAENMF